jgi:hypothetical protein
MKMKELLKQIQFGKIYQNIADQDFYVVPTAYVKGSYTIHLIPVDSGHEGYMSLKSFVEFFRILESEYD